MSEKILPVQPVMDPHKNYVEINSYVVFWGLFYAAVFALAALPLAWLTTLWTLPPLFRHYAPRANPRFTALAAHTARLLQCLQRRWLLAPLVVVVALSVWRSDWQDDIRQWVTLPPQWLQQAQEWRG